MKKAILVVSFGTTHLDTRQLTLDKIENKIIHEFKSYVIRRAFTSHIIIKVLKNRDGIDVDTPEEALDKLTCEGFEEVIVQPLHLIAGAEYDYITKVCEGYKKNFKNITLGRPILFYKGVVENLPDDYDILIESIKNIIPSYGITILMGHGSAHYSNASYSCLQLVLRDKGFDNVFIANVEGYPKLSDVLVWINKQNECSKYDNLKKEVNLIPLMVVAGEHAKNDMAGSTGTSWKNVLEKEGYKVNLYMHGLGEIKEFQDIYVKHIYDVIENNYKGYGGTKKGDA